MKGRESQLKEGVYIGYDHKDRPVAVSRFGPLERREAARRFAEGRKPWGKPQRRVRLFSLNDPDLKGEIERFHKLAIEKES